MEISMEALKLFESDSNDKNNVKLKARDTNKSKFTELLNGKKKVKDNQDKFKKLFFDPDKDLEKDYEEVLSFIKALLNPTAIEMLAENLSDKEVTLKQVRDVVKLIESFIEDKVFPKQIDISNIDLGILDSFTAEDFKNLLEEFKSRLSDFESMLEEANRLDGDILDAASKEDTQLKLESLKEGLESILDSMENGGNIKSSFKLDRKVPNIEKEDGYEGLGDKGFKENFNPEDIRAASLDKDGEVLEDKFSFDQGLNLRPEEGPIFENSLQLDNISDEVTEEIFIEREKLIEQVVETTKFMLDDKNTELQVKLKPDILGKLLLNISVDKDEILARALVDNYKTKELIEANIMELKESLEEQGLEIKTFEVHVGANEDFDQDERERFTRKPKTKSKKVKILADKNLKEASLSYDNDNLLDRRINFGTSTVDFMA